MELIILATLSKMASTSMAISWCLVMDAHGGEARYIFIYFFGTNISPSWLVLPCMLVMEDKEERSS